MRPLSDGTYISPELTPQEHYFLGRLYCRYHRKAWCYMKAHQEFKKKDLILTAAATVVTTGGLAGTAVFIPVIAVGVFGIILGVVAKKKNYSRKIELTRYAYTSFVKVLHTLKSHLRGEPFCEETLVHDLRILDDNITDLCPAIDFDKYLKKYQKVFDTTQKLSPQKYNGDDKLQRPCARSV